MNGKYYGRLEIRYHEKEAERLAHIHQKKERFKKMSVKGYKVFNPDWTCRNFQYQVGQTYEMEGPVIPCERGFHFCKNAADCFNHYAFNPENKVAEVIAHGTVKEEGDKCCTDKIEIVREISWQEVLTIVNVGKGCTGRCNTGNRNTGDWNTGDCNTGNRNTGDWNTGDWNTGNRNTGDWNTGNRNTGDWNTGNRNTGDWNTGNRNTGDCNTGDCNTGNRNTGDCNTGDWNTGNRNTGDWNTTSFSGGCFNTEQPKIYMFNKPSNWTLQNWLDSRARYLLNQIDNCPLEYIWFDTMTDEEKAEHPEAKTTGGYLKERTTADNARKWWAGLDAADRDVIFSLPNFDAEIFKEITGVDVNETSGT